MVALELGLAARFSNVCRDRADIAVALSVDILPTRTLRRKTSIEEDSNPMPIAGPRSWRCGAGSSGSCSLPCICAASGTTVIVIHQVTHVVDVGYSKLLAAAIFGLAGITSSFGTRCLRLYRRPFDQTGGLYPEHLDDSGRGRRLHHPP